MDKKRSQHFNFAFESLPVVFHSQTKDFFKYLDRDGNKFLEFWWDHIGLRLDEDKEVDFEGTSYELREIPEKKSKIILVTLPKPENLFEVYMMALVEQPKKRLPVRLPNTRVFALEWVPEKMSPTETIFGEITPQARYIRKGEGPSVDLEAFYQRVCETLWKK
jgi:hypothetical protein